MKKVVKIVLVVLLVCLFAGCTVEAKENDPIAGQWVNDSGSTLYLMLANGDAFQVGVNGNGEYITGVTIDENGQYTAFYSWYKEDGVYYWKTIFGDRVETVHMNGDTLVFGDSVAEWYRVPESEMVPLGEIFYSTVDRENKKYVRHRLSELIGE